jgi:CheY-like chemotaxis protein
MGGEIGVESEEGKGSTFWFTAVFAKQAGREHELKRKKVDLNDLRVLVVDDNRTNRFIMTEYLKSWGCKPVESSGGKDALSILEKSFSSEALFSLILTDFQMPNMSGFDLVREIKTKEALKEIPIILLTSAGRRGDGKNCREIGIDGYLTKPIRKKDLHGAMESVLGLSREDEVSTEPKLVTRHTMAEKNREEIQILLVEDYPTNQHVAMRHLQGAGHQVDLAENGQQAVEAYERKHYDLILMDIQMPVMDGYEATKEIRNRESEVHKEEVSKFRIPIVAMTAHAIKEYRERCFEAGMDDFISKPLRRKELLVMVEKWTERIADGRLPIVDCGAGSPDPQSATTVNRPRGTGIYASLQQSSISNNQSKEDAPMDLETAIEEFEGDKEFLMEVLDGFLKEVTAQIGTLRAAISDGDAEVVRAEAHSIKGGAANLTADDFSKIACELENIGKSGVLKGGIEVLGRLEKEFCRLEVYARDLKK